jgi:hypothetical protein
LTDKIKKNQNLKILKKSKYIEKNNKKEQSNVEDSKIIKIHSFSGCFNFKKITLL